MLYILYHKCIFLRALDVSPRGQTDTAVTIGRLRGQRPLSTSHGTPPPAQEIEFRTYTENIDLNTDRHCQIPLITP